MAKKKMQKAMAMDGEINAAAAEAAANSMAGDMAIAEMMTRIGVIPSAGRRGATAPNACVPADSAKNQTRSCNPNVRAHRHSS